jgi:hypothetical protein
MYNSRAGLFLAFLAFLALGSCAAPQPEEIAIANTLCAPFGGVKEVRPDVMRRDRRAWVHAVCHDGSSITRWPPGSFTS